MDRERIVVAEILRPRGNRGELLAKSQTDVPGRLENLRRGRVRLANGADVEVEIEHAWRHKDDWVLKLAGVDSISSAEQFRAADLWVNGSERGRLPEGEFFRSDLIGCTLLDADTGEPAGVVEDWQEFGGPPLMQLTVGGREVLVPFVASECRVDLEARTIVAQIPAGLLDL